MKKVWQRLISFCCVTAALCSLLPSANAATVSFNDTYAIANGLNYTAASSENGTVRQQSFRMEYTPGGDIAPIVAYGSKLYGKSTINEVVSYLEKQGQSVFGAANADFFVLSTGLPNNLVINEGRLVSSDGAWNAVGITKEGRVLCGTPGMAISLYSATTGNYPIYAINKQRTDAGIYLLNSDFSGYTRSTGSGTDVLLRPLDSDPLQVGKSKQFEVVSVNAVNGSVSFDENLYVLTASDVYSSRGYTISSLRPGEVVTLSNSVTDQRFENLAYACGGGNMIMKNGSVVSGLSSDRQPRTILGVRNDGSCVLMVHDGRQEISQGLTLKEAAQLLASQGCTDAINLDGGGSSAEVVRLPGSVSPKVVNSPSDGSLRACANYLLFVNTAPKTGEESGAFVYPHNIAALSGSRITLQAKTFDKHYYPVASYSENFTVANAENSIAGNVFTAPAAAGEYSIGWEHGGTQVTPSVITVYERPDRIVVKNKGSTVTSLSLNPSASVDLDIDAYAQSRIIAETDDLFQWSVTGNIGTISQDGVFTAGKTLGLSGDIVIRHKDFTQTIPVTIGQKPKILDTFESESNWNASSDFQQISGTVSRTEKLENVRYGNYALALQYQASAMDDGSVQTVSYHANYPISMAGLSNVTAFLKASPEKQILFDFAMGDGTIQQRAAYASFNWSMVTAAVPSGAVSLRGFTISCPGEETGTVYVDQLIGYSSTVQPDTQGPALTLQAANGALNASALDASGFLLSSKDLSLNLDGSALAFQYDPQSGAISAALPDLSAGLHRITLTASDYFGNVSRASINVGPGFASTPFNDLDNEWSKDYAEFLRQKAVFSTDSSFMPYRRTTNEMAATLLSRYLGLDTAQYANVKLPYSDVSSISSWALPHVRALYAKGIMIGGADSSGKSAFFPGQDISRAQVMTLLGRVVGRGFAYSPVSFDDAAQIPAWASDHINCLTSLGVISGYGGTNSVMPLNPITRGEFASLLFKLY